MSYRVDLDIYSGPMDLLLYLIRKEEVEITDIPIVRITEQYIAHLEVLQQLDLNVAADFLVMAATLMEIKSRMILPRPELQVEDGEGVEPEDLEDPRLALVQQLLEYKRFKEASQNLEALADEQSRRYGRPPAQIVIGPEDQRLAVEEMFKDVQVWDLVSTFARLMRTINLSRGEVVYDDTPVEEISRNLIEVLQRKRFGRFSELFREVFGTNERVARSHLIGAFLAVLECIKQRLLRIEQEGEFGDLTLTWREDQEAPTAQEMVLPPPEAVASRSQARVADGMKRRSHFKGEDMGGDESQRTEFDDDLAGIEVPEIETYKPIYSDDEIMGRVAPAEGGEGGVEEVGEVDGLVVEDDEEEHA